MNNEGVNQKMAKKLWSISTTVRSPYRVKDFLWVLSKMEGQTWNRETQSRFQIFLIQYRLYVPEKKGLTPRQCKLLQSTEDMTFEQAKEIFDSKNYEDPPMRGRCSYKPLEKAGLTFIIDQKIVITDCGKKLLDGTIEMDDFLFRSLINWQYPNPLAPDFLQTDGYNTKPFLSTLLLIRRVNQLCEEKGIKAKGISKKEFGIFVLSLINYEDIDRTARKLLDFRAQYEKLSSSKKQKEQIDFVTSYTKKYLAAFVNYSEGNLQDYVDNAIRYFRLTKYIYIRGGGYYIDLEVRRSIELEKLFQAYDGSARQFDSKKSFIDFMCSAATYELPWENIEEMTLIASQIISDIRQWNPKFKSFSLGKTVKTLANQITELRQIRSDIQSWQLVYNESTIADTIQRLKNIREQPEKPSIALEKYMYRTMKILNDAMEVKRNAPLGDDNEPTFTAPANVPDLECVYEDFFCICEVTMLTGRNQWYNEGQPVMRHLRDTENKYRQKPGYCLFVSPSLHDDTKNTFWFAIKYEYEGSKQRIVPLSISQIVYVLNVILQMRTRKKFFCHEQLKALFDSILHTVATTDDSTTWRDNIQPALEKWGQDLLCP